MKLDFFISASKLEYLPQKQPVLNLTTRPPKQPCVYGVITTTCLYIEMKKHYMFKMTITRFSFFSQKFLFTIFLRKET